jgi:integrase
MFSSYISKKNIRSQRTAELYRNTIRLWAKSRGFDDPDAVVQDINSRNLDVYGVLQEWVNLLHEHHKAPKTIHNYFTSVKGFLADSDIDITAEKVRAKIVLPQSYEVSTDRAPTPDEIQKILWRGKLATKAAITVLASSGMRLGEASTLRVSNIEFGEKGQPSKIVLRAAETKSRKRRVTFISAEATELVKEHLGDRIKDRNARIFKESGDALYGKIMRGLIATGLRTKEDADSARYSLHPHCFRKYFHTNMLTAGVDRGIVEGFEGHKFALDSAYLRMTDDELKKQYLKGMDRLTFLSTTVNNHVRSRLEELETEVAKGREDMKELLGLMRSLVAAKPKTPMEEEMIKRAEQYAEKILRDRGVTSE